MRIPIDWLKDVVSFRLGPDQLAKTLTMGGLETTVVSDEIIDVDVLPNRGDCWSILGVAREVSAITNFKLKSRGFKLKQISKKASSSIRVEVRDRQLCPRYMARVIEDVKVGQSPAWLKKRLEQAGIRSINNVVDVTNYLLVELGQPMHAFDAAKIADGAICVRRANPEEKVVALDEKEYILRSDTLVIADAQKIIAVAGIMGAQNSEINENTKTIVLESAFFDPISIHKSSKELKLRSESSVRFEHGVDWDVVEEALDRGAAMIAELGKARVLNGSVDVQGKKPLKRIIEIHAEKVNKLLGATIGEGDMKNILKRLGFKVSGNKVEVPLYRYADIEREIDLTEEISRIYGYGKIEATLPKTSFPDKQTDKQDPFRQLIAEIMVGCGFTEAQTYSMLGPKDFENMGLLAEKAIQISNPMNIEESIMRTHLLPGLLKVLAHNLNRQIENVLVFEIGKVYLPSSQKLPQEKWKLCVAGVGSPFMSAVDKGTVDYFYFKGLLENLLNALRITPKKIMESSSHLLHPGKAGEIEALGLLGGVHPDILINYEIKKQVYFFEIDLDVLFEQYQPNFTYQALPKFPAIDRDIAMFVPKGLEHQMIISMIKKTGEGMVEKAFLFDKYKDSLAYRIVYRSADKTLTDDEVNIKHQEILSALESKLSVRIRK